MGLLEIVVSVGLIALSVELIGDPLRAALGQTATIAVGVLAFAIGFAFLAYRRLTRPMHIHSVDGVLVFPRKAHHVVEVPGYRLSRAVSIAQTAVFAEQPALLNQWESKPIHEAWSTGAFDASAGSWRLLNELLEFVLVERLSTHLSGYFQKADLDRNLLQTHLRDDVPQILLSNRVLELLSRPMTDREGFGDAEESERRGVVTAYAPGGHFFSRFDLVLPADTSVLRTEEGGISLKNRYMVVNLRARWPGFGAVLPPRFAEFFLRVDGFEDISAITVSFELSARLRPKAVLAFSTWPYHRWIESFFDSVEHEFSWEAFLARIGWPQTEALLTCFPDFDADDSQAELDAGPS